MASKNKKELIKDVKALKAENKLLRGQIEGIGAFEVSAGDDVAVNAQIQALQKENGELKFQLTEAGVATLEAELREEARALRVVIVRANAKLKVAGISEEEIPEIEPKLEEPELSAELDVDVDEAGNVVSATKGAHFETGIKCPKCGGGSVAKYSDKLHMCPDCNWMGKLDVSHPKPKVADIEIPEVPQGELPEAPQEESPAAPNTGPFPDDSNPIYGCTSPECGWQGPEPRAEVWCPDCPRKVERIA